jgi:hypothetical protein
MKKEQAGEIVQTWLELAERVYEVAGQAAEKMQALMADEGTRCTLLDASPDLPPSHRDQFRQKARRAAQLLDMVELLARPSRRTLRNALNDGSLPQELVDEELRAHERATDDRYAQLPGFSDAELAAAVEDGEKWPQAMAAVRYEETDLTASEIGRNLGLSRSQVYAAVEWYRGLPGCVRDTLAIAVWTGEFAGAGQLSPPSGATPVVETKARTVAT